MSEDPQQPPGVDVGQASARYEAERRTGRWVDLETVKPARQDFLMYPYIPRGVTTTVAGDGGIGKSFSVEALAAAVSRGGKLPNGETCDAGDVLLLSAEDPLNTVIVPRLMALGADLSRIKAFNFSLNDEMVLDGDGLDDLEEAAGQVEPALIIVDPITHFMGDKRDMHRANEVRGVLARLNALAARLNCAVVVLAHFNKNEGATAAHRLLGSVDFRNAVRSMLVVGWLPDEPERGRVIFHEKANGSALGDPLGYDITKNTEDPLGPGVFSWQQTDLTLSEVFGSGKTSKTTKIATAREVMQAVLGDGQVHDSDRVTAIVKAAGASDATVRRAREETGVVIHKNHGGQGRTGWQLYTPPAD